MLQLLMNYKSVMQTREGTRAFCFMYDGFSLENNFYYLDYFSYLKFNKCHVISSITGLRSSCILVINNFQQY